jgi:hypothetical protein
MRHGASRGFIQKYDFHNHVFVAMPLVLWHAGAWRHRASAGAVALGIERPGDESFERANPYPE